MGSLSLPLAGGGDALLAEELLGALEAIRAAHEDIHCVESAGDDRLVEKRGVLRGDLDRVLEPHMLLHKSDPLQLSASALGSHAYRHSAERVLNSELERVHVRNAQHAQQSLETIDAHVRARIVCGLEIDEKSWLKTITSVCDQLRHAREALHTTSFPSAESLAADSAKEFVAARDALEAARHEALRASAATCQGLQLLDAKTHDAANQAMQKCLQSHRQQHVQHRYSLEREAASDEAASSLARLADSVLRDNERRGGAPEDAVRRCTALARLEQQLHVWRLGVARDLQAWSADGLGRIEDAYLAALEAVHDDIAAERTRGMAHRLAAQGSGAGAGSRLGTRVAQLCAQAQLPADEAAALLASLLE